MLHRVWTKLFRRFRIASLASSSCKPSDGTWTKLRFMFGLAASGATVAFVSLAQVPPKFKEDHLEIIIPVDSQKLALPKKKNLNEAIEEALCILKRKKEETGCPGLVVGVSINGFPVWAAGIGYADIENHLPCGPDTVMRIASISKSITATVVAKLWENGKLDLDKPIQFYVPSFPEKTFDGQKVTITTRQLLSHISGIRHYSKNPEDYQALRKKTDSDNENQKLYNSKKNEENKTKDNNKENKNNIKNNKQDKNEKESENKKEKSTNKKKVSSGDSKYAEFFSKEKYKTVTSSLAIFKDDPLLAAPGTKYIYTTYGYTLLSAIVESVNKEDFPLTLKKLLRTFGMTNTHLDEYEKLIPNRSRYYVYQTGQLKNVQYVDNSNKWAGGGIVSNVKDLLKFGNIWLHCYQQGKEQKTEEKETMKVNYLKAETVEAVFTPIPGTEGQDIDGSYYGLGWQIFPAKEEFELGNNQRVCFGHAGGAVGASSMLLILPKKNISKNSLGNPQGVVVAILANSQNVNLQKEALDIAKIFDLLDIRFTHHKTVKSVAISAC